MEMPKKGETLVLDPENPEHQAFMRNFMDARSAPVPMPRDSLDLNDRRPQRVVTDYDVEAIRRAEDKRARKAAKLR